MRKIALVVLVVLTACGCAARQPGVVIQNHSPRQDAHKQVVPGHKQNLR